MLDALTRLIPGRARQYNGSALHRSDRKRLLALLQTNADKFATAFDMLPRDDIDAFERLASDGSRYVPSFRSQVEQARDEIARLMGDIARRANNEDEPHGPFDSVAG